MRRDTDGFYAESEGKRAPFLFKQYPIENEYRLAVCAADSKFWSDIQQRKLSELIAVLA
jgi:hypothetical protein